VRRVVVGGLLGSGMIVGVTGTASAATTATFAGGVLTVFGDGGPNVIEISRDVAGTIVVNGGAVTVTGGSPTVATTTLIHVSGFGGDDVISLDERNGALPPARLLGGSDHDSLTGGSVADELFGQGGIDNLTGLGGADTLFGGSESDTLRGGDGNDRIFGESHSDRTLWNVGDDTDVTEGGPGVDSVEVHGGASTDALTAIAAGARVRLAGVEPDPFALDMASVEDLFVIAGRGNDTFSATGDLAALIRFTVDGGLGNDTLLGSNGADLLIGGDGNDVVDGQQGDDTAFLGARNDTFQWDPGDGSDRIEGENGTDTVLFNGSSAAEHFLASPVGDRVRVTRDVANVVLDTTDVESVEFHALGGIDTLTVDDLTGTDLVDVGADLSAQGGGDDGQPDTVIVNATDDDDTAIIAGTGNDAGVIGLHAAMSVSGARLGDRLVVNALAGDDVVDASALEGVAVTVDGGDDDDVLIGGNLDDHLAGGDGDDVLIGGPGADTLDGGPDGNVVLQATGGGADRVTSAVAAGPEWLDAHARTVDGKTVLEVNGRERTVPRADLAALLRHT
jgi:Ca2+-binding RTX toxin-like protein